MAAPAAPGKLPEVGHCRPAEAELCKMPEAELGKLLELGQGKLPEAERGKQSVLAAACRQRTERPTNDCKGTGILEHREARRVVQSWCW